MKNKAYMGFYRGNSPRNFNIHEDIEACKIDCENHAKENPRKRGSYKIETGEVVCNDLFGCDYSTPSIKGAKLGIKINWEE